MSLAHLAPPRLPERGNGGPHPTTPTLEVLPPAEPVALLRTGVVVLQWPAEDHIRGRLQAQGIPRLLVVDGGNPVPIVEDPLEDWMFDRADDLELDRRVSALERRARWPAAPPPPPHIDDHDLLRHAGRWVALPPGEAVLMRILLPRMGTCAPIEALAPEDVTRSSVRGRIKRLRERIAPLGFTITTVRSRGFVLSVT